MVETSGTRPSFAGELNNENPKQFWKDVDEYLSNCEDAKKCKRFGNLLKAGSAAESWFEELDKSTREDWDALEAAFKEKFIPKVVQQITDTDLVNLLLQDKPSEDDILTYKTTALGTLPYHVWWANELDNRVAKYKAGQHLAERVREALPYVLRKHVETVTSWKELYEAIKKADAGKMKEEVEFFKSRGIGEGEKKTEGARQGGGKEEKANDSEIKTLIEALKELTVARANAVSSFQRPPIYAPPLPSIPPTSVHSQRASGASGLRESPERRLALVRSNALAPPPDTDEGRKLYEAQTREWQTKHGGQSPNEYRPYPLTPGTLPVASKDCWRCGFEAHGRGNPCTRTKLPELETQWRMTAGFVERDARMRGVQLVTGEAYQAGTQSYPRAGQICVGGQWFPYIPDGEWSSGNV
ncbi:hypothetical protein C8Q73DRAFT_654462 [Cubamyces lactineus]|nr:hypothetical protein C8Q73DRAFT_654462 [Cubamyces lactineus]